MKRITLQQIQLLQKHYEENPPGWQKPNQRRRYSIHLKDGSSYPMLSVSFGLTVLPPYNEDMVEIRGIREARADIVMIKPNGLIPDGGLDFIVCDVDDIVSVSCILE